MNKFKLKQVLIDLEGQAIEKAQMSYEGFLIGNLLNRNEVVAVDDHSRHRASLEISEALDKQFHKHKEHLNIINKISFGPTDKVKPGAVVSVNGHSLIIAVPKPTFNVDGQKFIGISTKAPIYKEIKGKSRGDEFTLNGYKFIIEGVC